jgi:hypothetical protein
MNPAYTSHPWRKFTEQDGIVPSQLKLPSVPATGRIWSRECPISTTDETLEFPGFSPNRDYCHRTPQDALGTSTTVSAAHSAAMAQARWLLILLHPAQSRKDEIMQIAPFFLLGFVISISNQ